MNPNEINNVRSLVRGSKPLVHSITNPISINECANAVLCVGARPIMAEHPDEVAEITKSAKALNLNLGNITDVRMQSMVISANTAKCNNIPVVLDLVGIACSKIRRDFALKIITEFAPTVIKGNYSEIYALYSQTYTVSGVDTESGLQSDKLDSIAVALSRQYGSVVLASGKTDIITDGNALVHITNGSPQLAQITGTGCVLGCLTACFLVASPDINAATTACAVLGICGELAETKNGNGTFHVNLMDSLSTLTDEMLTQKLKMEVTEVE